MASLPKKRFNLKDVGAWDTLERVVVDDCKALEYGVALDVVGRGFVFWIRNVVPLYHLVIAYGSH